ncbi:hypothetical protein FNH22_19030 [Fulvivirga sp. M361]|uniref:M35 family metallo-endopeptidase n=1 Tax=Fulvivirga sp. M361 TaxID=2594266 RepID=UPI00117AC2C6|nr:M35 family metallo-endopeptidase [Fulvivirga sp. M361]TRX54849.1 hypothetical protein FNH22_19030 [Fulvivirga sp. M361]
MCTVLNNEQWRMVVEAKGIATGILKSAAENITTAGTSFDTLIPKYLSIRPTPERKSAYAGFFLKTAATIDALKRDNFNYDSIGLDEKKEPYLASVYAEDMTHKMTLTKFYFQSLKMTGYDSRWGTLIHEATHWKDVKRTEDWDYGKSSQKLCTAKSLNNADNWERMLENYASSL